MIMLIRYVTSQNSMKLVSVQFGTFLHRRAGSGGTRGYYGTAGATKLESAVSETSL